MLRFAFQGYRRRCPGRLLAVLFCFAFLAACGPSPPVYIPPEYRTAAPPPDYPPPPGPAPQTASPQGPTLQSPPEFRKQDIPAGSPSLPPQGQPVPAPAVEQARSPQLLASMQLVGQARASMDRGRPDAAIPVLEKAIQVDVQNAEAFMLLARAWRQKGVRGRAIEFARKAEILYQEDTPRLREVFLLEADLYREMGDGAMASEYRRKAADLR